MIEGEQWCPDVLDQNVKESLLRGILVAIHNFKAQFCAKHKAGGKGSVASYGRITKMASNYSPLCHPVHKRTEWNSAISNNQK